jgi:D-lactate dehydrogenase (cytochrome)
MTDEFLSRLSGVLRDDQFSTQADHLRAVSRDESSLPGVIPRAVIWPSDTDQISRIVKACSEAQVPITTRGAGSALEGSTIPCEGGIVLDLSRMTRVLQIWPEDLQAQVEPGLIYDHLNDRLKREGLFFPPSPGGSGDIATVGGMVATNASGIYSVKYGGTRDYLLQLEIVTGDGRIMTVGNRATKRSSGYNLVDLIAGSEGTLAIVTRITLRLAGIPEGRKQVAFVFEDDVAAAGAVSEMIRYGLDLAAVEFLDRAVLQALNQLKDYGLSEAPTLFLEFHGPEPTIDGNLELAGEVCSELGGKPLVLADGQNPWEIRHWATEAVKHREPGKAIIRNDVAFPISKLPEMVGYCHELGGRYGLTTHTFGHVGMGLLHALILADFEDSEVWQRGLRMSDEIIERTLALGGTISGEHGIGLGHKNLFIKEHGESVGLMRAVKRQFDPANVLNPGKIFD